MHQAIGLRPMSNYMAAGNDMAGGNYMAGAPPTFADNFGSFNAGFAAGFLEKKIHKGDWNVI